MGAQDEDLDGDQPESLGTDGDILTSLGALFDESQPLDAASTLVLTDLGRRALAAGDYRNALALLRRKHAFVLDRFGDRSVFAATSGVDLAEALYGAGDFRSARREVENSLTLYEQLGVSDHRSERALGTLAHSAYLAGDYNVAERLYLSFINKPVSVADEAEMHRAYAMDHLAQVYLRMHRYREAETMARQALVVFEKHHQEGDLAICLSMLASVCFHTNRYREAETLCRRSLELIIATRGHRSADAAKSMDQLAAVLTMRAQAEDDRSLCAEAVALGEEALSIFRETLPATHVSIAKCESNLAGYRKVQQSIGMMYQGGDDGITREHVVSLEQALGVDHPEVQKRRVTYAFTLCQEHSYDEALQVAQTAGERLLTMFGAASVVHREAWSMMIRIIRRYCSFLLGEPTGVLSPSEHMNMQMRAHMLRGSVYSGQVEAIPDESLALRLRSLISRGTQIADDLLEATWSAMRDRNPGTILLGRDDSPYWVNWLGDYLELLVLGCRVGVLTSEEAGKRAFKACQLQGAASSIGSALDLGNARRHAGGSGPQLRREQHDLILSIGAAEDTIAKVAPVQPIDASLVNDITQLQQRLAVVETELASETSLAPAIALEELRSVLAEDEAVVTYLLGTRAVFILLVSRRMVTLKRVEYESGLVEVMCEKVVESSRLDEASSVTGLPRFDWFNARELYKILIAPIETDLQEISTLSIVPDGGLWKLPFAVLVADEQPLLRAARFWDTRNGDDIPEGFTPMLPGLAAILQADLMLSEDDSDLKTCAVVTRNNLWLADRYATALLPSASALVSLRRAPPVAAKEPFLGIGSSDRADDSSIAYDTEELLRTIASALGASADKIIVGADATKERVLELDRLGTLAAARIVCFATHSDLGAAGDKLAEPSLRLATRSPDEGSSAGALKASEAALLHLDAEWVLLTACMTSSPSGRAAHIPLSGMARSFLIAGARTLLVSHWLVDAEATRVLMTELFHPALDDASKAISLQSAMATLRTNRTNQHFAHPGFWAGFSILGDPSAPARM